MAEQTYNIWAVVIAVLAVLCPVLIVFWNTSSKGRAAMDVMGEKIHALEDDVKIVHQRIEKRDEDHAIILGKMDELKSEIHELRVELLKSLHAMELHKQPRPQE